MPADFDPADHLSAAGAAKLDAEDPLGHLRSHFSIPSNPDGSDKVYLVGNSLGLMSHQSRRHVEQELDRWGALGADGHLHGESAWMPYHELLTEPMAGLVGGHADEVVVMNTLTVNLHLQMVSFYQPTPARHKILIEEHAFPSDHFAVESQIRQRGIDPATSLVTVKPRPGSELLDPGDIVTAIESHGEELALVLLPGVQYYTGQVLPMADITRAGHQVGAHVGWDLAHAVGNVELQLHDWDVDFAAWCTYKYLNSGPGAVAGCFIHRRHVGDNSLPKFLGWWGTNKATRFEMETQFDPAPTVESWQISNPSVFGMAPLRGSLDVFQLAGGIGPLRVKSKRQVQYMDALLAHVIGERSESITPTSFTERGCQFALRITDPKHSGRDVQAKLEHAGVACDWRYPDVIRVAPTPLYNTFSDIHRFVEIFDRILT
jgi:kynureninase